MSTMKKNKKGSKKTATENRAPLESLQVGTVDRSLWHDPFIHLLIILVSGFAVYSNSINVPFTFDDYPFLIDNPVIKSFDCFPNTHKVFEYAILQDIKNNLVLRPVAYFSFAVNYAIHGLNLFGYHLVNMLLHIGNAMLVYGLFSQLMVTPAMTGDQKSGTLNEIDNVWYFPLFAALLFACHPLQTQAVTYIIQRFVPLATCFYLASLVLYLQFRRAPTPVSRIAVYVLSLVAAILAMESKEIAFTLPIIIALAEYIFFDGKIVSRVAVLVPFFITMAIIPSKLMQLPSAVTAVNTENISDAINNINVGGISSWDYLMTQFGVIITYLRLLFLPYGQNFDYDYPLQQHFFTAQVLLPLGLLLLIAGTGVYLLKRSRDNRFNLLIAFGILWFFITLSVESSIVPIEDLIFEHRAYLPSIGFFIAVLAGVATLFHRLARQPLAHSKFASIILIVTVVGLAGATFARNRVWQDSVVFWNDVIRKSPKKARPYVNLGEVLMRQSSYAPGENNIQEDILLMKAGSDARIVTAINAFQEAIRLKPKSAAVHLSLARAQLLQKNYDEALRSLAIASELQPKNSWAYIFRGEIFEVKQDLPRARQEYLAANKLDPYSHVPHLKLAHIYALEGKIQAATQELELVMQIFPDDATRKKLDNLNKKIRT